MKRKDLKYYIIIAIILGFTIAYEILKPKPVDWSFSLEKNDKIPYGTFVLYESLSDLFPGKNISVNTKTTYEYRLYNQDVSKNYMYIADRFDVDKLETENILQTAYSGNNVFIAAHEFAPVFLDTLMFAIDYAYFDTSDVIRFYNPQYHALGDFRLGKSAHNAFFSDFDTLHFEVLAKSKKENPCFIRRSYGKGTIYLSTIPEIFTNYAMIAENNYNAAFASLSYLPVWDIVWDEYYKPYRKYNKRMLDIVFTNKSFKAAYTLLIITALLFVLFTAKRRQRIIPVIKPLENKSLQFITTIGRLYYASKNHKDIALKKFSYLNQYIYNKYYIRLSDFTPADAGLIAEKTGAHEDTVKKVLLNYIKINKIDKISAEDLNAFNNLIEDFYETCL